MKRLVNAIEAKEAPPLSWDHNFGEVGIGKTLRATMSKLLKGHNTIYHWDFVASALEPKAIEVTTFEKDMQNQLGKCVYGQCKCGRCRCLCPACSLDGGDCVDYERCRNCERLRTEWDRGWRRTWWQNWDRYDFGRGTNYKKRKREVKESYELFMERVRWNEYIG